MEEFIMLVSAKEMLEKAKAGHYAVGQFNINNLEWTKSVLLTAEELQSPVILGVSEGAGKYMTGSGCQYRPPPSAVLPFPADSTAPRTFQATRSEDYPHNSIRYLPSS